MERRSFIHKSGLGVLALVLVPWHRLFAGNTAFIQTFPISDGGEHIRHGMITATENLQVGPHWLTGIRRDVFFANGLEPSSKDWHCYSLRLDDQWISVNRDHNQTVLMLEDGPIALPHGSSQKEVRFGIFLIKMEGNQLKVSDLFEWIQIDLTAASNPCFQYGKA